MEKDKHMNKNAEETHDETSQDKLIERLIARIKNPSGRKNDGTDSEPQEENSADENSCGSEEKPEKQKIRDVIHRFRKITARETTEDEEEIPEIIHLPEIQTEYPVIDRYWLNPPYAHAAVCKTEENDLRYLIFEPEITDSEYLILEETFEYLRSTIIYGKTEENESPSLPPALLKKTLLAFEKTLTSDRIRILSYYLTRNFLGYGKLDPLLHDDKIEDITCNGPNLPLYLYHRKYGNIQTNCIFKTEELNKTVLKLAQKADKQISLSSPLVDAALPNGARVQLTYSDIISDKGSSFTIRKFKTEPMTPTELIASNTYSAELMAHIALAVENRKSIIIAGGTASGKTSTMNAASFFIPHSAKIVSLEDTREIQLPHTNWLPLKTRENQAVETTGDISMFSLLKSALRQRPEYIIVGEVRGQEAQTLFQAMNTGHTTFSTLHAGNVSEAVNRLTNDPINVPEAMFGALDLILIQGLLHGNGKGYRRCLSLNEISVSGTEINCTPIFIWNHSEDKFENRTENSKVFESIANTNGWDKEELKCRIQTRTDLLQKLADTGKISGKELEASLRKLRIQENTHA